MASLGQREWTTNELFRLINLYKSEEHLHDTSSKGYTDRALRKEALERIATHFKKCTGTEVARKWKILSTQFNAHHRALKTKGSNVTVKWRFFNALKFIQKSNVSDTAQHSPTSGSTTEENVFPKIFPNEVENGDSAVHDEEDSGSGEPDLQKVHRSKLRSEVKSALGTDSASRQVKRQKIEQKIIRVTANYLQRINEKNAASTDDCTVFGNFIANELRLVEPGERKELKSKICALVYSWK